MLLKLTFEVLLHIKSTRISPRGDRYCIVYNNMYTNLEKNI